MRPTPSLRPLGFRLIVCAMLSAVLSAGLAVACYWARISPAGWLEMGAFYRFGDLDVGVRRTVSREIPEDAEVLVNCMVGITTIDVRWMEESSEGSQGRQCVVTTFGWPQAILASGQSSVAMPGAYSGMGDSMFGSNSNPRSTPDVSWTQIHWSGVVFDIATGTLLLMTLSTWLPRLGALASARLRWSLTVVSVAWVIALALPTWRLMRAESAGPGLPSLELSVFASPGEFDSPETRHLFTSDGRDSTYYKADERSDFAVTWRRQRLLLPTGDGSFARTVRAGMSCSAGWPWHAFVMGDDNAVVIPVVDVSQLQVRWVPWTANVVAISALISSVFLPRYLIRRARRRRGQCRECGYPIGAGPTCPECGLRTSRVRLDAAGVRTVTLPRG